MRQEKQLLLDEIQELLKSSDTFLITRYQKLTAPLAAGFRKKVRAAGGEFEVVRKRILCKAAESAQISLDQKMLDGHIGVVFAKEDPVAATKAVFDYGKETGNAVAVVGGQFQGTTYSAEQIKAISTLPSLDEMRAQMLGLFTAPMSQTLGVMDALLSALPHLLQNKSET